jgi:phospholipase C
MRARAWGGLAVGVACAAAACSTSSSPSGGAATDASTDTTTDVSTEAATEGDGGIQLRYVMVLVKENHTFDSMFAAFPGASGALTAPLSDGGTLNRPTMPDGALPYDLDHTHQAAVTAFADGGMNGLDQVFDGFANPQLPWAYYSQQQIPNYWAYAQAYVLCDAFFATIMADSFPGYLTLVSGQAPAWGDPTGDTSNLGWSCNSPPGTVVNIVDPQTCATSQTFPCFSIPSVVDNLPAGITWRSYTDTFGGHLDSTFDAIKGLDTTGHTHANSQLLGDLAAGDIANITYIWGGNASEHPPQDVCAGENDTVNIVNALMSWSHWNETALIVTYDDWGGFYDHVAPQVSRCPNGQFFQPGFRLPTLILSPWVKHGSVLHTPTEQASIPRLIEDVFALPRMADRDPNSRDKTAGSLLDAFDFTQTPSPGPALTPRPCAGP